MAIVNVLGFGPVEFPDNTPRETARDALRAKFSPQSGFGDLTATQAAGSAQPSVVDPFTLEQRQFEARQQEAQQDEALRNPLSTQAEPGLGEVIIPGLEDTPADVAFTAQAIQEGDLIGTGIGAASTLIPGLSAAKLAGVLPFVSKASRSSKSGLSNALDDLTRQVEIEEAAHRSRIKPLQEEARTGVTEERKQQLLREIRASRQALDALKSKRFSLERRMKPKTEPVARVKPKGKPFKGKAFHQTNSDFEDFDLAKSSDGTVWFTTDKANFSDPSSSASAAAGKGKILEREINLKNAAGWEEMDKFTIDELVSMGFDGAVLDGDVQVFNLSALTKPAKKAL